MTRWQREAPATAWQSPDRHSASVVQLVPAAPHSTKTFVTFIVPIVPEPLTTVHVCPAGALATETE